MRVLHHILVLDLRRVPSFLFLSINRRLDGEVSCHSKLYLIRSILCVHPCKVHSLSWTKQYFLSVELMWKVFLYQQATSCNYSMYCILIIDSWTCLHIVLDKWTTKTVAYSKRRHRSLAWFCSRFFNKNIKVYIFFVGFQVSPPNMRGASLRPPNA